MNQITKVRDLMRIVAASSAVLLAMGSGPALAQFSFDGVNELTGFNSNNDNDFDVDEDLDFDFDIDTDIDNDFDADVNTGHNDTNWNTIVEDVSTGDIRAEVVFENLVGGSDNNSGIELGSWDVSADFSNHITGPNSDNDNDLDADLDLDVDIDKDTDIDNDIDFDANTGHNDTSWNTTVGDVSTGDIRFIGEVTNEVNNCGGCNQVDLNSLLDQDVDVSAENSTTGPNSSNKNDVDIDKDIDVDVDTDTDINNDFDIDANTGHNDTNFNTIVGDVSTGDVLIGVSAVNEVSN